MNKFNLKRNRIMKKELSKGSNKIILSTEDIDFGMPSVQVLQNEENSDSFRIGKYKVKILNIFA